MRKNLLSHVKRVVVKVGSGVLSNGDGLDRQAIEQLSRDLIELRNITTAAMLIVQCAKLRKESRGLHYNIDYPDSDDENWLKDTCISRKTP